MLMILPGAAWAGGDVGSADAAAGTGGRIAKGRRPSRTRFRKRNSELHGRSPERDESSGWQTPLQRRYKVQTDADAMESAVALETEGNHIYPIVKDARGRAFFRRRPDFATRTWSWLSGVFADTSVLQVIRVYSVKTHRDVLKSTIGATFVRFRCTNSKSASVARDLPEFESERSIHGPGRRPTRKPRSTNSWSSNARGRAGLIATIAPIGGKLQILVLHSPATNSEPEQPRAFCPMLVSGAT